MVLVEYMWRSEGEKALPGAWTGWAEYRVVPRDKDDRMGLSVPPPSSAAVHRPAEEHREEDSQANNWIRTHDEEQQDGDVDEELMGIGFDEETSEWIVISVQQVPEAVTRPRGSCRTYGKG